MFIYSGTFILVLFGTYYIESIFCWVAWKNIPFIFRSMSHPVGVNHLIAFEANRFILSPFDFCLAALAGNLDLLAAPALDHLRSYLRTLASSWHVIRTPVPQSRRKIWSKKVDVALSRTLDLPLLSLLIQWIDALDRSAILAGSVLHF